MTYPTEEQAREKWCPFVRITHREDWAQTNRQEDVSIDTCTNCIASGCAAWRWSRVKETSAFLDAVKEHMKVTGENFDKATQVVYADAEKFRHTEGYCGLATKPESSS